MKKSAPWAAPPTLMEQFCTFLFGLCATDGSRQEMRAGPDHLTSPHVFTMKGHTTLCPCVAQSLQNTGKTHVRMSRVVSCGWQFYSKCCLISHNLCHPGTRTLTQLKPQHPKTALTMFCYGALGLLSDSPVACLMLRSHGHIQAAGHFSMQPRHTGWPLRSTWQLWKCGLGLTSLASCRSERVVCQELDD